MQTCEEECAVNRQIKGDGNSEDKSLKVEGWNSKRLKIKDIN